MLLYRGNTGSANKNAAMLAAADAAAMSRAKGTARTLAAIDDVKVDRARYNRLNQEQKEELVARRATTADRLPDHVVMAFRHLLMLVPGGSATPGLQLLHDDLGPAAADSKLDERVVSHLVEADRLITGTLAPAALLTERFGVFADDAEALPIEDLRGYFARHPQLPKLGSSEVLQNCAARGVREGIFAIAFGATWNAPDSVLKIDTEIASEEVQFQPGVFLVKAGPARVELGRRSPVVP